jgi:acyl-CoA hydrolase
VDKIVTEYGVAELLYRSDCEKAKSLIAIAHPDFRDQLYFDAKKAGIIY